MYWRGVGVFNAYIYAMETFQKETEGEWAKAGIYSEEDINTLMREIRAEVERL